MSASPSDNERPMGKLGRPPLLLTFKAPSMAPSRRKTHTETNPARRMMTRSIYKKQQQAQATRSNNNECNFETAKNNFQDICSTPKGEKHMIPKIVRCPNAPKKKRLVLNCLPMKSSPSSSSPTKFFAHSDLEIFLVSWPSC